MDTFKFKITLDRHNGIQNLNYYDLPDPPRFSLPSTFKETIIKETKGYRPIRIRKIKDKIQYG